MRHALFCASIAALLCISAGVVAGTDGPTTHFRWHDAGGGLHYSDSIPPEAVRFGYDILSDSGLVVRHVEREQTPAERAATTAAAAKAAAEKRAVQERELADAQLLAAYPDEAMLRNAHHERLQQMQRNIITTQSNLRSQENSLADLLAHAADIERSGKTVPPFLKQRLAEQRQSVADERHEIVHLQNELAETKRKLDAELLHYRAISAQTHNGG